MHLKIESSNERKFIGQRATMSFSANKTGELWRRFMPRRKEIENGIGTELFSIEIYPPDYFREFNPAAEFEKWAAIETADFDSVPAEMETLISPPGLYAVFLHRGAASAAPAAYRYIFETWLPASDYALDDRPHFAVMGAKYKNDDPDSEEELWIPVKKKISREWHK